MLDEQVEWPETGKDERQWWMSVLARATADQLKEVLSAAAVPSHSCLRGPETGLLMVRGKICGDGADFNVGEATVTRCTVRTAEGGIGHAYVLGCDHELAKLAALADALLQSDRHDALIETLIVPLADAQQERRAAVARKVAATKVNFSTMAALR
ncbi:MAG: phosphonate C-P lyase system protein PhnG [Alphaproteobacteria bacterium]|nr:phosphonate C-P lyase system protein PhnG [Alphaproteobacteria bacterium]